jgi:hypothetical protein
VFAIEWSNVHLAGAFLLGAVFSAIVMLRLARVIAQFLGEIGRKERHGDETDRHR